MGRIWAPRRNGLSRTATLATSSFERFQGAQASIGVTGTGFPSDAVMAWNGTDFSTTFNSSTSLTVTIPETATRTTGTKNITVRSLASGVVTHTGSFTCTQWSKLRAELDPNDSTRILDGSDLYQRIPDISGLGWHADQATAGTRPPRAAAIHNGRDGVLHADTAHYNEIAGGVFKEAANNNSLQNVSLYRAIKCAAASASDVGVFGYDFRDAGGGEAFVGGTTGLLSGECFTIGKGGSARYGCTPAGGMSWTAGETFIESSYLRVNTLTTPPGATAKKNGTSITFNLGSNDGYAPGASGVVWSNSGVLRVRGGMTGGSTSYLLYGIVVDGIPTATEDQQVLRFIASLLSGVSVP